MKTKISVTRMLVSVAIGGALFALPLLPVTMAGADTGSSISGTVTDLANPTGLLGVCVSATQSGTVIGTATTASDGTYQVDGLSAGTYNVEFDPTCAGALTSSDVAQFYSDDYSVNAETPVVVGTDVDMPGIDAALDAAGTITGTASDTVDPSAAAGVCVQASDAANSLGGSGTATTAVDGSYAITGLAPGSYQVHFDPTCSGSETSPALPQWYLNAKTAIGATPVSVTAGNTTPAINALLLENGSISGTVTDATHPGGLVHVCIAVASSDGGSGSGSAITSANGTYTVAGLAPDSYTVHFDPSCSGSQSTPDSAQSYGSNVSVTSGTDTTNTNALLATIAGPPGYFTTSVQLKTSVNPLTGTGVTYAAIVSPTVYTGTVNFYDATVPIPQCQDVGLTLGYATCFQQYPPAGIHPITVDFSGSPGYLPSASSILEETVTPTTTTTVSSIDNHVGTDATINFTAKTTPSPDGGTVQFQINGTAIPDCAAQPLAAGVSSCQVKNLSPGSYAVTAVYSGDTLYLPSTSTEFSEQVLRNSAVSVTSTKGVAKRGQVVHFVGRVAARYGTGFLTFTNGVRVIPGCGKVKLQFGVGICTVRDLSVGRHIVSVGFSGNASFSASYSGLLEIIKK